MKPPTRNESIRYAVQRLQDMGLLDYASLASCETEERRHRAMTHARPCPVGVAAGGLILTHIRRILADIRAGTYDAGNALDGNAAVLAAYRAVRRALRVADANGRDRMLALADILCPVADFDYATAVAKRDEVAK